MKKKEKGFSLLELMTTIGIISIIGAVGFPAIDNFGDQENYETDLATIRGQINYVRQLSLEDGNAYTIRIINDTTKDRKSTRLNSSHSQQSRMPSSA